MSSIVVWRLSELRAASEFAPEGGNIGRKRRLPGGLLRRRLPGNRMERRDEG
jgi:hypothetical protein